MGENVLACQVSTMMEPSSPSQDVQEPKMGHQDRWPKIVHQEQIGHPTPWDGERKGRLRYGSKANNEESFFCSPVPFFCVRVERRHKRASGKQSLLYSGWWEGSLHATKGHEETPVWVRRQKTGVKGELSLRPLLEFPWKGKAGRGNN